MKQINWSISREDDLLVGKIIRRAIREGLLDDKLENRCNAEMDLTATHLNNAPLDLQALLEAARFDFAHDLLGITRHLNRDTGKLGDFFVPRFTARRIAA